MSPRKNSHIREIQRALLNRRTNSEISRYLLYVYKFQSKKAFPNKFLTYVDLEHISGSISPRSAARHKVSFCSLKGP